MLISIPCSPALYMLLYKVVRFLFLFVHKYLANHVSDWVLHLGKLHTSHRKVDFRLMTWDGFIICPNLSNTITEPLDARVAAASIQIKCL